MIVTIEPSLFVFMCVFFREFMPRSSSWNQHQTVVDFNLYHKFFRSASLIAFFINKLWTGSGNSKNSFRLKAKCSDDRCLRPRRLSPRELFGKSLYRRLDPKSVVTVDFLSQLWPNRIWRKRLSGGNVGVEGMGMNFFTDCHPETNTKQS